MKTVRAWHFVADSKLLRDGKELPEVGVWERYGGEVVMCQSGLHASRRPLDALQYAPGAWVRYVECRDIVEECDNKLVCRERRTIWQMDATDLLRDFARKCALDVVHLWKAPDVVMRYLKTGDESLRDASRAASWDASRAVSWAASRAASWAASKAASWDAPRAVSWAASRAASRAASGAASWAASWAASRAKHNRRLTAMLHARRAR